MDAIIYHKNCHDGFCCAWLCHLLWPNAKYIAAQYGHTPPDVTGKDVLIADFSYKRDQLLLMKEKANSLIVLDHHDTAKTELEDLDFCTFDMNRSGARLTWDHLITSGKLSLKMIKSLWNEHYNLSVPHWIVAYVEDRDLWRFALQNSRVINAVIRLKPYDFSVWDKLSQQSPESLLDIGNALVEYQTSIIDHHLHYLRPITINGLTGKGVQCSHPHFWSELMHRALEAEPSLDFAAVWQDQDDNQRIYSIRSVKSGVHVGEVAKMFGGGGHACSAGFRVPCTITLPPGINHA